MRFNSTKKARDKLAQFLRVPGIPIHFMPYLLCKQSQNNPQILGIQGLLLSMMPPSEVVWKSQLLKYETKQLAYVKRI